MKVHEYQAKELLSGYGIPVPRGKVAGTAEEAGEIARQLGGRVVIKAQIHGGGRGKSGGIKVAETPDEAGQITAALFGERLITRQTGPAGLPVNTVLVEEIIRNSRELYLGILIDTSARAPVMIASDTGGTEIEDIATKSSGRISKQYGNMATGFMSYQARALAYEMNMPSGSVRQAVEIMTGLYRLFIEKDCSLVEINPLVIDDEGKLLALDAKINFDDNALINHPDIARMRDNSQEEPLEVEAGKIGVNYIKIGGNVGCLVNGAGLAMVTMDMIKLSGGEPANFLDVGGSVSEERVASTLRILLTDTDVRAAWINIFGGILRCDIVARALVQVLTERKSNIPFVVRMNGTNFQEARQILQDSKINVIFESDIAKAAEIVVRLAE